VVERLLKDGHEVTGVDNFDTYYSRSQKEKNLMGVLLNPRFKLVEDNLSEMALVKVARGQEAVVHLAAQAGVRSSWGAQFNRYLTSNVTATQKLLEEVKGQKLHRFVYASSSSVYGDIGGVLSENMAVSPRSPYGVTKLAAEHLVQLYHQEYKLPTVALRFFSVYGPRQRPDMAFNKFCQSLVNEAPLTIYGDGKQVRDFTFVTDVAEVVVQSLTCDAAVGEVVNVGGGSPATLEDAIGTLLEVSGKTAGRHFLEKQKGDVRETRADTAKLERIFGFKPQVTLREGLSREWEWASSFLLSEAEELAIKSQVQPISGVDAADLEAAKADAKAHAKAKRKEAGVQKKKKETPQATTEE
jgi:UDP-glucose 4-epimerase